MRLPSKDIGEFAVDLLEKCSVSRPERLQRGTMFKNLFLTGNEDGTPAIYNHSYAFIDNLSSYLYSPVELRFNIDFYGSSNPVERAKMRSATSEFHKYFRRSGIDTKLEEGVTWSLVKGKTFQKLKWTTDGLGGDLLQPEVMSVLEENLGSLNEQDAFIQSTFISPDRLWRRLRSHPQRDALMAKAKNYLSPGKGVSETDSQLRQIIVGGVQPYISQGSLTTGARGQVNWITPPSPQFSAQVAASLIPFHEAWVWNDEVGEEGDWTTIQFVGRDLVVAGDLTHRNIFADQYDPANKAKRLTPSDYNPLTGKHPFIEICPNPLEGYFWGRSELCNTALLQKSLNCRIDGINQMLRRQEDPPKFFSGTNGIKASAYSMMKKAGGYLSDSNPNAKVHDLYPQLPEKLFESLHEIENMFDKMAGFTPQMSGRGESGVRSQGHAESLIRTGSPRFKDRALAIEREVEEIGGVILDLLKAHVGKPLEAWLPKQDAGVEGEIPPENPLDMPPYPGSVSVEFLFHDLPENAKVVVDSHSSSPAFAQENRTLMFDLLKVGAIDPEQLLIHVHPPGADAMIENLQRAKAEKQAFAAAHPEIAAEEEKKNASHKKK